MVGATMSVPSLLMVFFEIRWLSTLPDEIRMLNRIFWDVSQRGREWLQSQEHAMDFDGFWWSDTTFLVHRDRFQQNQCCLCCSATFLSMRAFRCSQAQLVHVILFVLTLCVLRSHFFAFARPCRCFLFFLCRFR